MPSSLKRHHGKEGSAESAFKRATGDYSKCRSSHIQHLWWLEKQLLIKIIHQNFTGACLTVRKITYTSLSRLFGGCEIGISSLNKISHRQFPSCPRASTNIPALDLCHKFISLGQELVHLEMGPCMSNWSWKLNQTKNNAKYICA